MTKLTKVNRERLQEAVKDWTRTLRSNHCLYFNTRVLASLYMTDDDIAEVDAFCRKFSFQASYVAPSTSVDVTWTHPVVGTVNAGLDINLCRVPGAPDFFWPKGKLWPVASANPALLREVTEAVQDYVQYRSDMQVYIRVVNWISALEHVEEMRYLFPPILTVFRKAGLDAIANKLQEVRRPPSSYSHVPAQVGKMIKFANKWAAFQIVTGKFDPPPVEFDVHNTVLTLDGNVHIDCKDEDGEDFHLLVHR